MTQDADPTLELKPVDVDPVLDVLERYLLGGPRSLTRLEVAERAGVAPERSETLWRALGFTRAADEDVVFGDADVRALRIAKELFDTGLFDEDREAALARTLGRTYARLAEWQVRLFAHLFADSEEIVPADVLAVAEEYLPRLEELQAYLWRRAIIASAGRMLLRPVGEEGPLLAVGFADIVGYTSQSRQLSDVELEQLVEHFENTSSSICTDNGGRIIKNIGDEVLFVADEPSDGARIALALVERHEVDETFPLVRAGLAYGPVLPRLGDVYGSVVNLAARLTTLARPGRVLVDSELAAGLDEGDEFSLRRTRRMSVKGFHRVEPYRLKRARDPDDEA